MKIKKKKPKVKKADQKKEEQKSSTGFGVLGKDLASRYSRRGDGAWVPTRPGGRNGQGKPS